MFLRSLHKFNVFNYPDDIGGVADPTGDDADILADDVDDDKDTKEDEKEQDDEEDDDTKDDEKDDDDEEEVDDKEKEDEDEEGEDEDDDKEDDEQIPVELKEIKKEFPELFKKFPDLRGVIYRESEYAQIFANPQEAARVAEKAGVLEQVEADLFDNSDPSKLLASVEKSNKGAFEKLALNILPTLQEQNKDVYLKVAAIPIKQLLRSALQNGKGTDGKLNDLGKSALWIHNYFFGEGSKVDDPVEGEIKSKPAKSDKETALEQRLREIEEKEHNEFRSSVDNSYISRVTNLIKEGLDKDERLNDFTKRTIIRESLSEIKVQLEKDPRYLRQMNALWKQARENKYSNDFKSRILNAALARAKSLVPSIRQKIVSEATGTKAKKDKIKAKADTGKKEIRPERNRNDGRPNNTSKPKTDLDILRS